MSGRLVPYVSKAPPNFEEKIEEALELKMYLISEKGPTSLLFTDEEETIIRLQLGLEVTCSCSTIKNKQCKHTLFALLKKFRVDKKSPILWQGSYIDSEIEGLISGKYQEKTKTVQKKKFLQANSKFKSRPSKASIQDENRKEVVEDDACPICQEDMTEEQPLSFCRKQCGNNFHVKCLKIWCQHKLQQGNEKIPCPMCRSDLGRTVMEQIRKDEHAFIARFETHSGKKCKGCGKKPIVGSIYHCLICANVDLCHLCYQNFTHIQHNKFLTKKTRTDKWRLAAERDKARYDLFRELVQHKGTQKLEYGITQQIFSNPNDNNDQESESKNNDDNIEKELVYCLPLMQDQQNTQKRLGDLQIVGLDVNKMNIAQQCVFCNQCNTQAQLMRRLGCGHAIDDYCLFQMLKNQKYFCPVDGEAILPGYNSAFGIQNKMQKMNTDIQVQNNNRSSSLQKSQKNEGMGITGLQLNKKKDNGNNTNTNTNKENNSFNLMGSRFKSNSDRKKKPNQFKQQRFSEELSISGQQSQISKTSATSTRTLPSSAATVQSNQKRNKNFIIKKSRPPLPTIQQRQQLDFNVVGGGLNINQRNNNEEDLMMQQQQQQQHQIQQVQSQNQFGRSRSLGRGKNQQQQQRFNVQNF